MAPLESHRTPVIFFLLYCDPHSVTSLLGLLFDPCNNLQLPSLVIASCSSLAELLNGIGFASVLSCGHLATQPRFCWSGAKKPSAVGCTQGQHDSQDLFCAPDIHNCSTSSMSWSLNLASPSLQNRLRIHFLEKLIYLTFTDASWVGPALVCNSWMLWTRTTQSTATKCVRCYLGIEIPSFYGLL